MAKLTYIDARTQVVKAEYDGYFYGWDKHGLKIYRDKLKHYVKELKEIEKNYMLYPNNKEYLLAIKRKIKNELLHVRHGNVKKL